MKALKKILIVLIILVGLVYVGGYLLPKEYGIKRSISIEAPVEIVYGQINELTKWPSWSPWTAMDPEMAVVYSDATSGEGSWYSWEGPVTGTGKLTVLEVDPYKRLNMAIEFGGQDQARADWIFEADGGNTTATWTFEAKANGVLERYSGLVMDSFLGPMYEDGLSRLKIVSEKMTAEQPTDGTPAPNSANEVTATEE